MCFMFYDQFVCIKFSYNELEKKKPEDKDPSQTKYSVYILKEQLKENEVKLFSLKLTLMSFRTK